MKPSEMADYNSFLTPDAFIVYPSRLRLLLGAVVCAAFAAGATIMWNEGDSSDQVLAVVFWIILGLAILFFMVKLAKRTPSLIINQTGIFENSSAFGAFPLRWEEIDGFFITHVQRQKLLAVRVKDLEGFLARQSAIKAKLMRANVKLVGAPITLATGTLPINLDELIHIIRQKAPAIPIA